MKTLYQWFVSVPRLDRGYATGPVAFRLLTGAGQDKAEIQFAIERCEHDRAGGERWVDVTSWSQTTALKNLHTCGSYTAVALLAAAVAQLADEAGANYEQQAENGYRAPQ